jgi:hypothetical protein
MPQDDWSEELPPNCPPAEARPPGLRRFYRLVNSFPPSASDFLSNRALFPDRRFNVDECIARALSIFETAKACSRIRRLPLHRDQVLVAFSLPDSCGVILRTAGHTHYSWWSRRGFNPIPMCTLVGDE